MKNLIARIIVISVSFGVLIGCVKSTPISLPGFAYLNETISLDVSEIQVINKIPHKKTSKRALIPASIGDRLEDWAHKRFVAGGSKGKAVITIEKAGTFSRGLKRPEQVGALLNSEPPAYFGARGSVTIQVFDTPSYSKGNTDIFLKRKVEVDSDLTLVFRRRLWQEFMQNFMNAFDEQARLNLETYLPKVLMNSSVQEAP